MSVMKIPHLTPKIIEDKLKEYDERSDESMTEVMREVRKNRYMTKDHLVAVARWKAYSRNIRLCEKNSPELVEQISKFALAPKFPKSDEEIRIMVLRCIKGVDWAMASAILHFYFGERYPIFDERAMYALKSSKNCSLTKWQKYTDMCCKEVKKHNITMRELDRVLWVIGVEEMEKEKL